MALSADTLLDRMHLKSPVARWRAAVVVILVVALIAAVGSTRGG